MYYSSRDNFLSFCADEINAILRVDNVRTVETGYKPCSQQAWDQRYTIELDRVGKLFEKIIENTFLVRLENWKLILSGEIIEICVRYDFFDSKILSILIMKLAE